MKPEIMSEKGLLDLTSKKIKETIQDSQETRNKLSGASSKLKANNFDKKFESCEDLSSSLDFSKAKRINQLPINNLLDQSISIDMSLDKLDEEWINSPPVGKEKI